MTGPAPLYAFDIDAQGRGAALAPDALEAPLAPGALYRWVHYDLAEPGVADWIARRTDPIVAAALTRTDTRPRMTPHGEGLLVFLRGVNLNPGSDPEDMVSIRVWIEDGLVISTRLRRLMAVVAIREALEERRGPSDPGGFIARLASGLTERMDPVIAELADEVDALEETSLLDTRGLRGDLAEIRRTTIVLRRYVGPQRDALAQLSSAETRLLGPHQRVELREVSDRITRMVEELDGVRDRSAILNDQLADQRAEDMNATMLVLSVVAAIFLPLGFLTGLLGINVGGMPGASTGYAFWVVVALCAGLGGGLAWMFRRRGWI